MGMVAVAVGVLISQILGLREFLGSERSKLGRAGGESSQVQGFGPLAERLAFLLAQNGPSC